MDIDEFLDRELSGLGLSAENEKEEEQFDEAPLFDNIKSSLGRGNIEEAELAYVQLWHLLLRQKLKWNKELYEQLAFLNRQFSSALSYAGSEVKRKSEQINDLVNRAKAAMKEGRKEMPFKLYSEIMQIYESVPNAFFEEKKIVEKQIADFYKELQNATDSELIRRISAVVQEIYQLLAKINNALRVNDTVAAIVSYNKCIELYSQIPEGFLRHKTSIGATILEIYKNLSIRNEISTLQQQLNGQQPQSQHIHASHSKKESAKSNIRKGLYNEALRDIQESLEIDPNDAEAKAIHAKIKTLQ